jgi:hypothetical protein
VWTDVDKWDAIVDSGLRVWMEDFPARFSTGWVGSAKKSEHGGGIGFGRGHQEGRAAEMDSP